MILCFPVTFFLLVINYIVINIIMLLTTSVLYAVGPLYYHSQYLVRVEAYDAATLQPLMANINKPKMFNLLDRIASNSQKVSS